LDTLITTKAPSQEEPVVAKSLEAPPKKSTPARASKRLKKTVTVGTSLEAHRPIASSNDVSTRSCSRFFHCFDLFSHYLVFAKFDAKISLPWR
jgi:hypothetical protein